MQEKNDNGSSPGTRGASEAVIVRPHRILTEVRKRLDVEDAEFPPSHHPIFAHLQYRAAAAAASFSSSSYLAIILARRSAILPDDPHPQLLIEVAIVQHAVPSVLRHMRPPTVFRL